MSMRTIISVVSKNFLCERSHITIHQISKGEKERNYSKQCNICDRLWENRPLRAQFDFSVEAFVVYLT